MERLSLEVFRMWVAVGWTDGELRPSEIHLIVKAARAEGLDAESMAAIDAACQSPLDFGELDQSALNMDARLYVYAMSSWIARSDGRVAPEEVAALHALATLIGVTGRGRQAMDEVVDELYPSDASVNALRAAIVAKVQEIKTG
jgi:uncharacterized membrane protein YebE (DUF533 family)